MGPGNREGVSNRSWVGVQRGLAGNRGLVPTGGVVLPCLVLGASLPPGNTFGDLAVHPFSGSLCTLGTLDGGGLKREWKGRTPTGQIRSLRGSSPRSSTICRRRRYQGLITCLCKEVPSDLTAVGPLLQFPLAGILRGCSMVLFPPHPQEPPGVIVPLGWPLRQGAP